MRVVSVGVCLAVCGCPFGLVSGGINIANQLSGGVTIDSVTIIDNNTGHTEYFDLADDPIMFDETRGFCCYNSLHIFNVFVLTSTGEEIRGYNRVFGENAVLTLTAYDKLDENSNSELEMVSEN